MRPDLKTDARTEFLDDLEDLVIRMIKGGFIVFFVKAPQKLWRFVTRLFPNVVKGVRIMIILWVWMIVSFGPAALLVWTRGESSIELPPLLSEHHDLIRIVLILAVIGWTSIFGIIGSIYGIAYLKDRRRRKLAAAATRAVAENMPPALPPA